jgi:hypothetical protein
MEDDENNEIIKVYLLPSKGLQLQLLILVL